jgi:hypothetical protein
MKYVRTFLAFPFICVGSCIVLIGLMISGREGVIETFGKPSANSYEDAAKWLRRGD